MSKIELNIEKTLGYGRSYDEARDTMHPDPQFDVEPPVKSQKGRYSSCFGKRKRCPTAITCLTGIC